MNAALDAQRERLRRLDDSTLTDLSDHIRALHPDPQFDSLEFLCRWIFLNIPALNALDGLHHEYSLVPAAA